MLVDQFKDIWRRELPKAVEKINNRQVFVYGASEGGAILCKLMESQGIVVSGFIDQNNGFIDGGCYLIKKINEMNPTKEFIVIGALSFEVACEMMCHAFSQKYTYNDMHYAFADQSREKHSHDITYKGCIVGRYTYGYSGFLSVCGRLIVEKIGRFCSINDSARAVPNHTLNSVSSAFFGLDGFDYVRSFASYYDQIKEQMLKKIIIGNDVWIGANAVILPSVHIGDGAVIGAGAVVTKDVEPYSIVGGVPAKLIRYRFDEHIRKALLEIKWWDWDVETIQERVEDFYDIEAFVKKYS